MIATSSLSPRPSRVADGTDPSLILPSADPDGAAARAAVAGRLAAAA